MRKSLLVLSLLLCCGLMNAYAIKQAQAYNAPTPSGESYARFKFKGVVVAAPYHNVVLVKLEDGSVISVKLRDLASGPLKDKHRSAAREHLEKLTLNHQVKVSLITSITNGAVCGWVEVIDVPPDEYLVNLIMVRDGYAVPHKVSYSNLWKNEKTEKIIEKINKAYEDALFNAMDQKLGMWAEGKLE